MKLHHKKKNMRIDKIWEDRVRIFYWVPCVLLRGGFFNIVWSMYDSHEFTCFAQSDNTKEFNILLSIRHLKENQLFHITYLPVSITPMMGSVEKWRCGRVPRGIIPNSDSKKSQDLVVWSWSTGSGNTDTTPCCSVYTSQHHTPQLISYNN